MKTDKSGLPWGCAGCDNPGLCDGSPRLWSLVNQFYTAEIVYCVHEIGVLEGVCFEFKGHGFGAQKLPENFETKVYALLDKCLVACAVCGLEECSERVAATIRMFRKPFVDISTFSAGLNILKEDIMSALKRRSFLRIAADFAGYVDQDSLFGPAVSAAFPSSSRDIMEAGNCLAAECGTACVFHLMRASEFALRALARDRRIEFHDKPLEEKEWGTILSKLAKEVDRLREIKHYNAKDIQIRFYSEVVQELRSFNDVWRRHVSHADTLAFYGTEEALCIFRHARTFMQKLSQKISEAAITEELWS